MENRKAKVIFEFDDQTLQIETQRDKAFIALDLLLNRTSTKPVQHPQIGSEETRLKIPHGRELEQFIRSQPDYQFSVEAIAQHFMGDKLSNVDESEINRWFAGIRAKTYRIRKAIAESENGEWTDYYDGRNKVFRFIKKHGGEIKENSENKQYNFTDEKRDLQANN